MTPGIENRPLASVTVLVAPMATVSPGSPLPGTPTTRPVTVICSEGTTVMLTVALSAGAALAVTVATVSESTVAGGV